MVGFGTKVGFAPLHTWLPDAHSEAPSPVSALLSGALLANAFYAILRFYQVTALAAGRPLPRRVLLVFGTVSLVVAALFVLRQENYKRLLAYSSIEHMGVIALGIGFGVRLAVAGALLHVINHAAAKGLAFFGAGRCCAATTQGDRQRQRRGTVLPWSGPMFLAAALALSGCRSRASSAASSRSSAAASPARRTSGSRCCSCFVNVAFLGVVWHAGRMVLSPPRPAPPRGETSWWMVPRWRPASSSSSGSACTCRAASRRCSQHAADLARTDRMSRRARNVPSGDPHASCSTAAFAAVGEPAPPASSGCACRSDATRPRRRRSCSSAAAGSSRSFVTDEPRAVAARRRLRGRGELVALRAPLDGTCVVSRRSA